MSHYLGLNKHLVLKYHGALLRYIQTKLDISSLGVVYRHAVEIEQNLKQKMRQFGIGNPAQQNLGKGGSNLQKKGRRKDGQYEDNQFNLQERRTLERRRKIPGRGTNFIRGPGITLLIVARSSNWWLR
jgi:hypothetical protein